MGRSVGVHLDSEMQILFLLVGRALSGFAQVYEAAMSCVCSAAG